ncbi:MAG TPA: CHAT domain-containing protein [Pyrinomonadaceae bacterium]|nr:CHAT domain-containing protein [Pyrinomonadaceae bacterium]
MERSTHFNVLPVIVTLIFAMTVAVKTQSQTSTRDERRYSSDDLIAALLNTANYPELTRSLLDDHSSLVSLELWQRLTDEAARNYHQNDPRQAIVNYHLACAVALRLENQSLIGRSFYNLGRSHSGLNQYDQAIKAFLKSREAFSTTGSLHDLVYVFSDLGTVSIITEDYDAARNWSEESIKLWLRLKDSPTSPGTTELDTYGAAGALSTLGELASREGNFDDAFDYLQQSHRLFTQLQTNNSSYRYYLADVCTSLGRLYTSTGDHVRGLAFLNRALTLSTTLNQPNQVASILNEIGYLHLEQENYAQAQSWFQQSLLQYTNGNNTREVARTLLNLGVVKQREHNFDDALTLFQASLETARTTNSFDVQIAAAEGIGVVLTAKRDFQRALGYLDTSLALAIEKKDHLRECEVLWRIAEVQLAMNNLEVGFGHAQSALEIARFMHSPKLTYLTLATIGKMNIALNRPELAVESFKQAVNTVELMRLQVAGDGMQRNLYFQDKLSSYHSLIDLLLKEKKDSEAFLFAERAKGRVLLDVFRSVAATSAQSLSSVEKAELRRLNQSIFKIGEQLRHEESALLQHDSLSQQLSLALSNAENFQNALYQQHPDLQTRSGRTATIDADDLAHLRLNKNTACLEYVISQAGVTLFLLRGGDKEELEVKTFRLKVQPQELLQKVSKFHARLAMRHPDFADLAQQLYAELIEAAEPELEGVSNVCIIPDDFLWNLPFQVLKTNQDHYLLEKYSLSYAPSVSVLFAMSKKSERNAANSLVAFGNPRLSKRALADQQMRPLPEAESEVRAISRLFPPQRNTILTGSSASEQSFKSIAQDFTTIHFATHGLIDNKQPLNSYLLLAQTNDKAESDGRLEARELLDLKLNADLAVLSGCNTANGQVSAGEGMIGMSWAFFVAGARSMIASQWPVQSASTSQLMKDFYSALQPAAEETKQTRAQALRTASLRLMKSRNYNHPFYWAPFMLVGAVN